MTRKLVSRGVWWLACLAALLWSFGAPSTIALAQGASFTITAEVDDSTHGSINPSGAVLVEAGGSQTFVVTTNPGYKIAYVQVDGRTVGTMDSYTFTGVSANHAIVVGFSRVMFTIEAISGPDGVLSPTITVECGASQTFTIKPNDGYRIGDVLVDGASQGPVTSYTFTNVWRNHTISATFVALQQQPTVTGLPPGPGVTELAGLVSETGVFLGDVHVASGDRRVGVTVAQGTTGRLASGEVLGQIAVVATTTLPEPAGFAIVGSAYEVLPDNAVVDKSMSLTMTYDRALVPAGIDESELGIAVYDRRTGDWTSLPGATVDTTAHSVSAMLAKFTACAVVAPHRQAGFTVSDLQVSPGELQVGDEATASVTVTNSGTMSGTYSVALKINGTVASTKDVTLAGGASEKVDFAVRGEVAGPMQVSVEGLSVTLPVGAIGSLSSSDSVKAWLPLAGAGVGLLGVAALVVAWLLWRRGHKPSPVLRPAAFELSDLEILPQEVSAGESTTVAATVANTGEHAGTLRVVLSINGRSIQEKDVTVLAGGHEKVEFIVRPTDVGVSRITVGNLSDTLTVKRSMPLRGNAGDTARMAENTKT